MSNDMKLVYTVDADYSALSKLGKAATDASAKAEKGFKKIDSAAAKTEKSTQSLSDKVEDYSKNQAEAASGSKRLADAIRQAVSPASALAGGIGVAAGSVAAFTAAIVAGTTALIAFGEAQSKVLVDLDNLARNAGTGLDTFQVLAREAAKFGLTAENVADILQDTSDRIGEFTLLGEGEFVDLYEEFFKPIGIGVEEMRTMKPEKVLRTLHEEMKEAGSTTNEITAFFEQLASNSWRLAEVWALSESELSALKDQMEREGRLVTEDDIRAAREINEQAQALSASFQHLKTTIMLSLQEPIKGAIGFVDSLINKVAGIIVTTDHQDLKRLENDLAGIEKRIETNTNLGFIGALAVKRAEEERLGTLKEIDKIKARIAERDQQKAAQAEKEIEASLNIKDDGDLELTAYDEKVQQRRWQVEKIFADEREKIEIAAKENAVKIKEYYNGEDDLINEMLERNNQDKLKKLAELADREAAQAKADQLKIAQAKLAAQREAERQEQERSRAEDRAQGFISYDDSDLTRIAKHEAEKLRILEADRQKDLISESTYQQAKTAIQKQAEEERNNLIAGARQRLAELTGDEDDPLKELYQQQAEKMAVIDELRQQELISDQQFQDAKTAIVKQATDARLQMVKDEQAANYQAAATLASSISGSFSDLTSAISNAQGEQSSAYQASIAAQKAFALASASISLGQAVAQAMAEPAKTTAEKFANYAAISSALGGVISSISSVSYGGGRAMGGSVQAGKMYEVGERGVEMFQSGGRNFMIPDRAGNVVPNDKLGASMGNSINVVQNFTVSANATYDPQAMSDLMSATKSQTLQILQQQTLQGGLLSR